MKQQSYVISIHSAIQIRPRYICKSTTLFELEHCSNTHVNLSSLSLEKVLYVCRKTSSVIFLGLILGGNTPHKFMKINNGTYYLKLMLCNKLSNIPE